MDEIFTCIYVKYFLCKDTENNDNKLFHMKTSHVEISEQKKKSVRQKFHEEMSLRQNVFTAERLKGKVPL